jgi:polyphosphate kinase
MCVIDNLQIYHYISEYYLNTDSSTPKNIYFNRELAWIEFNRRVLEEAYNTHHPLLERLKFLIIFTTNLDEFFMIRISGLKEQFIQNNIELSLDGLTASEQLHNIRQMLLPIIKLHEQCFSSDILPSLSKQGVRLIELKDLNEGHAAFIKGLFVSDILPVLTPLAIDPGHPFPRLLNRSINIVFLLTEKKKSTSKVAVLQVPPILQRFVNINVHPNHQSYVLLEKIIQEHAEILFPGFTVQESHCFRVTRDADLDIAYDEAEDLMSEIAEQVRHRRWGTDAVRLEVEASTSEEVVDMLIHALEITKDDVYLTDIPLNISDFYTIYKLDKPQLKDTPFLSRQYPEFMGTSAEMFENIKKRDILVHHPFDSFTSSVVRFLQYSAVDPDVLAIKITLYRAGGSSPVIEALKTAAENGKQVTAFVELRARFDEENNINWAKELENVGVHVVYGVLGLKIHSKIAMIVRKEHKIRTYLHLSTGNYNVSTSRIYTDIGYFTCREDFVNDAIHLFNMLTGYSHHEHWDRFSVAPDDLRLDIIELITRETMLASQGKPGRIIAKLNALVDRDIIDALYKASQNGVSIDLIVRGVCCLAPNIPGLSDNIRVRSVIGRFLEHSRIFYFQHGGDPKMFVSSADWMPRNFNNRIEIMFPILDKRSFSILEHILSGYLSDTDSSWILQQDGTYIRNNPGNMNIQHSFLNELSTFKHYPTKLRTL